MKKVGIIGLGTMGGPIARNVVRGGFEVAVYDINASAVQALVTGQSVSSVSILDFAAMSAPLHLTGFVTWWWTRRWHRPADLRLSWRGVVLHVARWPIVLWAFLNVAFGVTHPYMITPKGDADGIPRFSLRSQMLYLALIWLGVGVIAGFLGGWWGMPPIDDPYNPAIPSVDGSILLALWGIGFMALVVVTNLAAYLKAFVGTRIPLFSRVRVTVAPLLVVGVTLAGVGALASASSNQVVMATTASVSFRATDPSGAVQARALLRLAAQAADASVSAAHASFSASPTVSGTAVAMPELRPSEAIEGAVADATNPADYATDARGATDTPALAAAGAPTALVPPGVATMPARSAIASDAPRWAGTASRSARPLDLPTDGVAIGMYDPWQTASGMALDLEHWYVRQDEPRLLRGALTRTRDRRIALVTIEPFPKRGDQTPVLDLIVQGERDAEIRRLAGVVRDAAPQVVLVRWGHEMDLSGLYPWSANHPDLYQEAYRRVVETFRAEGAHNARWVWSPVGNEGLEAYYPGDDVVDYVGVTVLGDPEWDANFALPPRSSPSCWRRTPRGSGPKLCTSTSTATGRICSRCILGSTSTSGASTRSTSDS